MAFNPIMEARAEFLNLVRAYQANNAAKYGEDVDVYGLYARLVLLSVSCATGSSSLVDHTLITLPLQTIRSSLPPHLQTDRAVVHTPRTVEAHTPLMGMLATGKASLADFFAAIASPPSSATTTSDPHAAAATTDLIVDDATGVLLHPNFDVNFRDGNRRTPLILAAKVSLVGGKLEAACLVQPHSASPLL